MSVWLAALVAVGALGACAAPLAEPSLRSAEAGWRVIERVGEARYRPPGSTVWVSATTTGRPIADGSEIATGRGGRLIVGGLGRQVSVGPSSRFVLPRSARDDRLHQRAGRLRYHVADARPVRVQIGALELEAQDAVFDVRVDSRSAEIEVEQGRIRVATADGTRAADLTAGEAARADDRDDRQLAVRAAPGQAYETVEPMMIPASLPKQADVRSARHAAPVAPAPGTRALPMKPVMASPEGELEASPGPVAEQAARVDGTVAVAGSAADTSVGRASMTASTGSALLAERRQSAPQAIAATPPSPAGVRAAPTSPARPSDVPEARSAAPALEETSGGVATDDGQQAIAATPRVAKPARDPSLEMRMKFERLTEGMVDAVRPMMRPAAANTS